MIYIAHLYPNELNLYGENGNLKALTFMLDKLDLAYKIIPINPNTKLDLDKYDFIYIGSGRKQYLDLVQTRLIPYKEAFLKYISMDKPILVTGNAIAIFTFLDLYKVKYQEERKVSNVLATTSLCKGNIKGFQNTEYLIDSNDHILFQLYNGYGNQETKFEGYQDHNFYATSIIGPLLARNDELCKYFVNLLKNQNQPVR